MFEFPKQQKLCNETAIKEMFSNGKSFVIHPIRLVWKEEGDSDTVAIKSIIVVPKKQLKLAFNEDIDSETRQSLQDFAQDFYSPLDVQVLKQVII